MAKVQPHLSGSALVTRMRKDVDEGRFSEAAALYDRSPVQTVGEAVLLRAWIYIKKRAYAQAIELLNSRRPRQFTTQEDAERLMLLGVAHSRSSMFAEADEYFERASTIGQSLLPPGELAYWRGRRYLEQRRLQEAEECLAEIRSAAGENARIWATWLESGLLTHQHRYLESALLLMHLLEFLDGLKREYREDEIWALHTLSTRARELDAPKVRRFVQARVNRQQWTDDFRVNQFQTYKAVAWCHALEGDYFNGFRYLKMAGAIAPSPPWQAMTLLDRAYLAKCIGESVWSRSELAEAQEVLEAISWRETNDEERAALPLAAELYASVDSGRAASYLARFFELRDAMNPQLHMRYDDRLSALGDYANGIVQTELGNRKSAAAAFRKAWDTYDEIGYDWRAGRCALRLYDLTRDNQWLERAGEKLHNYTGSWLHDELRRRQGTDLPVTPAQKRVLDLLVAGKTTEEIARVTGTRPFTIQNHIKAMLRAFDVPNRSVLIAQAMQRSHRGQGGRKTP